MSFSAANEARKLLMRLKVKVGSPAYKQHWSWAFTVCDARAPRQRKHFKTATTWTKADRDLIDRAAAKLLADPELRATLDALHRLGGLPRVRGFVGQIGRLPPATLEAREERRKAAISAAVAKRAQTAYRMLERYRQDLARAEKGVRKWSTQVRYYQKTGALPEDV